MIQEKKISHRLRGRPASAVTAKIVFVLISAVILIVGYSSPALSVNIESVSLSGGSTDLMVEADWLEDNYNKKNTIVVDTRSADLYTQEHIVGAVNIPVESTFGAPPENDMIAPISHIQKIFSTSGIDNNTHVVLYDDGRHVDAARVFWVFEVYGHKHVVLLNGGYAAWKEKSLPVSSQIVKPEHKEFLPTIVPNILSTKFSTRLAINDVSKTIVDARSEQEYSGQKSQTSRFGHIPSAINIPHHLNYAVQDGVRKIKPIAQLENLYERIDPNKKVITYCNRGKESALTYFILRRLGFNVSAYDGSWMEWSSDNSLPVDLPQNKQQ